MTEITAQGSQYDEVLKTQVIADYAVRGNATRVAETYNIPSNTVGSWVRSEWGQDLLNEIRAQNQDSHISKYHELTEQALDKALDAIKSLPRDELKASDIKALIVGAATATDKSRLLMNQPTSIKGDSSTVSGLVDQFNKLSQEQDRIRRDHDNIQGSVVDEAPGEG
jgi:hypothetical protein